MKRLNLILMAMSLCFGAAIFIYTYNVARESRAIVSEMERDLK